MLTKRILVIGLYPIVRAHHGGSRRARAMVAEYRRYFSHVHYTAVFSRASFPQRGLHDFPVSMETDQAVVRNRELEDVIVGRALYTDPEIKKQLIKLLRTYRPDIIQLEQPYAFLGLEPLLAELGLHPQLVYDAHNVEGVMKAEVYAKSRVADLSVAEEVMEAEQELARLAKVVIAVSEDDAGTFRGYGARRVVVARNGSEFKEPSHASRRFWQKWLSERHIDHPLTYVGSAHLPNWYGLKAMMGEGVGFLPPNARLIIAGAMSDYLRDLYHKPKTPAELAFLKRTVFAGRLSNDHLNGLLASSRAILLPITSGGGSNLKTAEALLSTRPIVATTYAFRSFESFVDFPTVRIGDDRASFQKAVAHVINAPEPEVAAADRARLRALSWSQSLQSAVKEVSQL